jgi:hypothetical protein
MAGWMPRHAAQCRCLKGSASSKPFAHALVRSMRPRSHVDRMLALSANDIDNKGSRSVPLAPWPLGPLAATFLKQRLLFEHSYNASAP